MEIIAPKEQIRKFFFEKHFDFLTSVPQQRLQEMILSSCVKGHSGKMSDYGECGPVHRTTYGHFLSKGKWDDKRLEETQKRESFQTISELSRRDGTPLFISADDTVLPDRKFCVNADKLSSRKEEQLRGFFGLDTARLNSAYPPVFRAGGRYARAA